MSSAGLVAAPDPLSTVAFCAAAAAAAAAGFLAVPALASGSVGAAGEYLVLEPAMLLRRTVMSAGKGKYLLFFATRCCDRTVLGDGADFPGFPEDGDEETTAVTLREGARGWIAL